MNLTDQEIISALEPLREDAREFQEVLSPEREKFQAIYRAQSDLYGEARKGWASTVAPVVFDTVEWIKPFLGDIFNGEFFSAESASGDGSGKSMRDFIKFKLWTQGHVEEQIDDFIHYCLSSHYGIFKITHQDNFHYTNKTFKDPLTQAHMTALENNPNIEVTKYDTVEELDPITGQTIVTFENVKVRTKIQDYVGPVVECVPPTELYMSQGYTDLRYCPLVAHVVERSLDYVRVKERDKIYKKGSYEAVKAKVRSRMENDESAGEIFAKYDADGLPAPSEVSYTDEMVMANAVVEIWECYTKLDIDGDGYLEDALVVLCDDVVLVDPIENEYRSAPFELGVVIRQPHNLIGMNFAQIMADWQRVSTNLQRGIQDAALLSTKRGFLTTSVRAQNALRSWMPGDTALVDKLNDVRDIDFGAPSQFLFKAYDQVSGEIDRHSGVSEASQGLDRQAANKTLGAFELKLTTSQQRQVLYAKRLSRTFERVLRRVVDIFRLHPPADDVKAVGMDINLEDIDFSGEYTFKIDVGVGEQQNQEKARLMDQHLQFLTQAGLQMGIADPTHVIRTIDKKANYLNIDMTMLHKTEEEFKQIPPPQPQPQGPPNGR